MNFYQRGEEKAGKCGSAVLRSSSIQIWNSARPDLEALARKINCAQTKPLRFHSNTAVWKWGVNPCLVAMFIGKMILNQRQTLKKRSLLEKPNWRCSASWLTNIFLAQGAIVIFAQYLSSISRGTFANDEPHRTPFFHQWLLWKCAHPKSEHQIFNHKKCKAFHPSARRACRDSPSLGSSKSRAPPSCLQVRNALHFAENPPFAANCPRNRFEQFYRPAT